MSDNEAQGPVVVWGIPVPRKANGRHMWPDELKSEAARRVQQLRDGLVEGAGFNPMDAAQIIAPQQTLGFADAAAPYQSDPLPAEAADPEVIVAVIDRLPPSVKTRLSFDTETRTLTYKGPMTREGRNLIHLAFAAVPNVAKTIDRLYAKSNQFQTSAADEDDKPPFIVPLLGFRKQGELQLFSQEHFLDLPWRLDQCDPAEILTRFRLPDTARTGEIDVGAKGAIEIGFPKKVQAALAGVIQEPAWNLPRLANWIDSGIVHPDITKPSAVVFITKAIDALIAAGHDLPVLARHKYDLRKALGTLIGDLRGEREVGQYKALFAANAADFAVSADLSIIFDEQTYAPNQPYSGATKFAKHYTRLVGDLLPTGEEFDCAVHLDRLDKVRYWIRNIDRKKSSFWLQLPHDKFYPDFVAMLTDGRILVVEYKGGISMRRKPSSGRSARFGPRPAAGSASSVCPPAVITPLSTGRLAPRPSQHRLLNLVQHHYAQCDMACEHLFPYHAGNQRWGRWGAYPWPYFKACKHA